MDLNEFNNIYLSKLLDILSKEKKTVFQLGEFNIDLHKHEKLNPTNKFIGSLSSNVLIPYILHPTRIHGQSRTITDNIFFNQYNKETISGNLTPTISDHLTQFLFVPSMFSDPPSFKQNMYERNWFKLNKEDFILDYFMKAWDSILYLSENDFDFDFSFNNFLMNMNELLETHPRKHLLAFKTS